MYEVGRAARILFASLAAAQQKHCIRSYAAPMRQLIAVTNQPNVESIIASAINHVAPHFPHVYDMVYININQKSAQQSRTSDPYDLVNEFAGSKVGRHSLLMNQIDMSFDDYEELLIKEYGDAAVLDDAMFKLSAQAMVANYAFSVVTNRCLSDRHLGNYMIALTHDPFVTYDPCLRLGSPPTRPLQLPSLPGVRNYPFAKLVFIDFNQVSEHISDQPIDNVGHLIQAQESPNSLSVSLKLQDPFNNEHPQSPQTVLNAIQAITTWLRNEHMGRHPRLKSIASQYTKPLDDLHRKVYRIINNSHHNSNYRPRTQRSASIIQLTSDMPLLPNARKFVIEFVSMVLGQVEPQIEKGMLTRSRSTLTRTATKPRSSASRR
jgi:hypothetical protein